MENLVVSKSNNLTVEHIESMSLGEIEKYGSDVQSEISDGMSKILESTKCIGLEKTGKSLSDLSVETNQISKKIGSVQKFPAFLKASKWLARYDSVEHRISSLEEGVVQEKDRLNAVLDTMHENLQFMRDRLENLEQCQSELQSMVEYYQQNDEDGLKLQAAMHRLKIITTTISVVKQECAKTILIIKENKEVTNQLAEASDNLIPIFKVMMLNVIGAKTNAEAMQLKQNLSKVANEIIVSNAKQIEKTAEDLIRGREEPLISAKSIEEANSALQNAILKVQSSAKAEVQTNMDSVKRLENSIKEIDGLMQNGLGDVDE